MLLTEFRVKSDVSTQARSAQAENFQVPELTQSHYRFQENDIEVVGTARQKNFGLFSNQVSSPAFGRYATVTPMQQVLEMILTLRFIQWGFW